MTSTPTIKGASKIERAYMTGTQEEWHTQCPHCQQFQYIRFEDIRFDKEEYKDGNGEKNYHVRNVRWRCPKCEAETGEFDTKRCPAKWVARNPRAVEAGIRSFRLNAFMSPWSDWTDICRKFLRGKDDPEQLKTFYNTILGETWEIRDRSGTPEKLFARREHYNAEVPSGVLVLTCGIDTQGNRLEYEVVGWDREEQSWGILRGMIFGRADAEGTWEEVDDLLDREFTMKNGMKMRISATFMDSGGNYYEQVVKQCARRNQRGKKIWAIKGDDGQDRPLVRMMKRDSTGDGSAKFIIGVDGGKEAIMYSTTLTEPGPRYMHFPIDYDKGYDEEYFRGLCSEKAVIHRRGGKATVRWEKFYERNEPLDMRNYARAAYKYFRWNFDKLENVLSRKGKAEPITRAQAEKRKYNPVISRGIQI